MSVCTKRYHACAKTFVHVWQSTHTFQLWKCICALCKKCMAENITSSAETKIDQETFPFSQWHTKQFTYSFFNRLMRRSRSYCCAFPGHGGDFPAKSWSAGCPNYLVWKSDVLRWRQWRSPTSLCFASKQACIILTENQLNSLATKSIPPRRISSGETTVLLPLFRGTISC